MELDCLVIVRKRIFHIAGPESRPGSNVQRFDRLRLEGEGFGGILSSLGGATTGIVGPASADQSRNPFRVELDDFGVVRDRLVPVIADLFVNPSPGKKRFGI